VGIADAVPKSIAYRLLEPALDVGQPVRLICHEGKFADLLGQLAIQRLDLVIADEPMNRQMSVKAFNHPLGNTAMSFYGAPALVRTFKGRFPHNLDGAPLLVQGSASAVRQRMELWLTERQIHARIVGEFDDAALMKAFGREGRGVFMSPTVLDKETCAQYGVKVIGRSSDLVEEFFAVSVERRITHPCVVAITQAARSRLFRTAGSSALPSS
jgi:LysR family transcriptional activator of nhaA